MNTPIWKYTWNSSGYTPESFEVSTTGKKIGDFLYLPHTYFKSEGFSASIKTSNITKSLTVAVKETTTSGDLTLFELQPELSALAQGNVYRKIRLNSKRTCDTVLSITCSFVADAFDPNDFGQSLNKDADVEHKSVTAQKVVTKDIQSDVVSSPMMTGEWGQVTKDVAEFSATSLKFGDTVIEKNSFSSPEPFTLKSGTSSLGYDKELKKWVMQNERSGEIVPIVTLFTKPVAGDMKYRIPVVLASDPTSIQFVDWLSLLLDEKGIKVDTVIAGDVKIQGKTVSATDELSLAVGDINIHINKDRVKIGPMTITSSGVKVGEHVVDKEFLLSMDKMKNKLNDLKDMVEKLKTEVFVLKNQIK